LFNLNKMNKCRQCGISDSSVTRHTSPEFIKYNLLCSDCTVENGKKEPCLRCKYSGPRKYVSLCDKCEMEVYGNEYK
jgi:uncharacterized paraquat-inducible protein A